MKVVINTCHGGFSLSEKAVKLYNNLNNSNLTSGELEYKLDNNRTEPILIQVVQQLQSSASNENHPSKLKIIEIPDDIKWEIQSYDGKEAVVEVHRRWC